MKKFITTQKLSIFSLLFIVMLTIAGCSFFDDVVHLKNDNEAILLSDRDSSLMFALADKYNNSQSEYKVWLADSIDEKNSREPDIYLLEYSRLLQMENDKKLLQLSVPDTDSIPDAFKSSGNYWYGIFYDPVVLLINQNFARRAGQENIRTWEDLLKIHDVRIALENLSDTEGTRNFLCAFASHWGEENALNYLRELHKNIPLYSKFPFTPIRMTAVGDADIALTRSSYIFQYLENAFPAYVALPLEGTPVNLWAIGINAQSSENKAAADFCRWLLTDEAVRHILMQQNTGLEYINNTKTDSSKLWLNTHYLTQQDADALVAKWLDTVRFKN